MNVLIHQKEILTADSADTSKLQPSDWNAGHKFTGGAVNQPLVRDPSDATFGVTWGTIIAVTAVQGTMSAPSPLADGMWWVEASGSSPSRTISFKARDQGVTRTLFSITF